MARSLIFLGTHLSAGKSLMATAFCRILARWGYRVAPFEGTIDLPAILRIMGLE